MREQLLHYYERELTYLRRMGAEFAERYPKVASRLMLEANKCEDPHVERLLEGFAFLAARVHLRIDDDLPEISEALLNVIYPHYVRPIPAMSIVEFRLDPEQGKLTTGYRLPRDTMLYSRPVDGVPCKFRTCYDTTLWPIEVVGAQWTTPDRLKPAIRLGDSTAVLRLELRCQPDVTFKQLNATSLRLYLDGAGNLTAALYELLNTANREIVVREIAAAGAASSKMIALPPSSLQPAGLGANEGMLPYPGRSFEAYRLLQEYLVFPEKYLFLDLFGFDAIAAAGMGRHIEVLIPVPQYERAEWRSMLEAGVTQSTFRLGCSPVINLFPHVSEPVLLTQRKPEYQLIADARRRLTTEIFSVDDVTAIAPDAERPLRFRPFYAPPDAGRARRTSGAMVVGEDEPGLFWIAKRRESGWRSDDGTDILLTFVDRSGRTAHPDRDSATARLTCFNSDLPSRLPFGSGGSDFELENRGPIRQITALIKPTRVIQPPLGSGQTWRLISQLSLNYLSLVESGEEALRETLRLYDFGDSPSAQKQISGIVGVRSEPSFARIVTAHGLTFARGRRIEVEFDEDQFAGSGIFLFGTVLERFFGLYASINSFSSLAARSNQRKRPVHEWPARSGWKSLL
ncbi:MAG TPA: type VI secretion system baseplate subunit TssF [Gemmatimonadaceae bacterium]|jgi:type VI secretion system protein ImpG|nr:type VI secretion system baseplate subunit TssF [Gemmatimonadaceae bacterium]